MTDRIIQYSIIVPLYNEELVVQETYRRLKQVMDSTSEPYEIIFVNDGSKDKTLTITKEICRQDNNIRLLSFSRNFGHQVAITAGMDHAGGRAIVVIDADLQDPPEMILKMIEKWQEGYDVVYGQRIKRKGETFFKKLSAKLFYLFLNNLTDIEIPVDTGDFRLIDRKVCEAFKSLPERNRYVRGLIGWLGFRQIGVEFVREERLAGESKYPLKKMIRFALDGITSFSRRPLKVPVYLGFVVSLASGCYLLAALCDKIFVRHWLPGWSAIVALSLLFNGLLFICLGIIGEYIGRIYDEAKGRPLYIIGEREGFKHGTDRQDDLRESKI